MIFENKIIQEDMAFMQQELSGMEQFKNKTVLITGANGMLATYLTYFFMYLNQESDYDTTVLALVRNEQKAWERFGAFKEDPRFQLLVQDVCEEITYDKEIDYIFHLAGNASPRFILEDPVGIIEANTIGTMNMMNLARKANTKRVLYASTREVYGKVDSELTWITEEDFGVLDPTERRSCYPESKRMAESMIQSYYHQYGVDSVIVRIAHSYGPGMIIDNDGRVMADFISDVVHGRDIVLKSTGDAIRAFCYITDAVCAMLAAVLNGKPGEAYNIANETEPLPIREVAQLLVGLFPERGLKVVFDIPKEMSLGYSKMGRTALSTKKIEAIGGAPKVSLEKGLKRTLESFLE